MKKVVLFILVLSLISCGTSDGFKKAESIEQLDGEWIGGNDVLKIDAKQNTIQFNDGSIQKVSTEDDGFYFFINAFTGNTETFAGSIEIKDNEIRVDRIDGGIDMVYRRKVNASKPKKRTLSEDERILSKDVDFYQIGNENSKLRTLKKGTIIELQSELLMEKFYSIYLPYGIDGEINVGFIIKESLD